MRYFDSFPKIKLRLFTLAESRQCNPVSDQGVDQQTQVSALSQTQHSRPGHGFGFGVFLLSKEHLSASIINLRDYNFVPNENGQSPRLVQILMRLAKAGELIK